MNSYFLVALAPPVNAPLVAALHDRLDDRMGLQCLPAGAAVGQPLLHRVGAPVLAHDQDDQKYDKRQACDQQGLLDPGAVDHAIVPVWLTIRSGYRLSVKVMRPERSSLPRPARRGREAAEINRRRKAGRTGDGT